MCCFLETEVFQTTDDTLDDGVLANYIHKKIKQLEHCLEAWYIIVCCFLEPDEFQTTEEPLDDDALAHHIHKKIEMLERRLEAWKSRRNRLTQ